MDLLSDIITYVRRIIKSPSNSVITDSLIVDYINRFWIMDVDARLQLFDLKTTYQFQTAPSVDRYNMPLYDLQPNPSSGNTLQAPISSYPVYQGFLAPVFINGIEVPFYTQRNEFNNLWPNYVQTLTQAGTGNGTSGPYTLTLPFLPNSPSSLNIPMSSGIIRGHIDITGIIDYINEFGINQDPPLITSTQINNSEPFIQTVRTTSVYSAVYFTSTDATGANVVIADSGEFLATNVNYGLLMQPGNAPFGNQPLGGPSPNYSTTQNTINYLTGIATNVYFPTAIPNGMPINSSCYFYQLGLPRSVLFYNNTLTLRAPPNTQYLVELNAYLTPAAFLSTSQAVQFGYMSEYIARGAARKILADTGDVEQFAFYEPLFKEQELLVWKRSQRQFTSTRTQTIYSASGFGNGLWGSSNSLGIN